MNKHNYIIYRGLIIFLILTSWWIAFSYFSLHYLGHNFSYVFLLLINLSLAISIFVFDIPSIYTYNNKKKLEQNLQTPRYYVKIFNKLILTTRWIYLLCFPLVLVIASLVEIVCSFYFVFDLSTLVASATLLHLSWLSSTIITLACFDCLFFVIFSVIFFYISFDHVIGGAQINNSYFNNFFLGFNIANFYFAKKSEIATDKNFKYINLYLFQNSNYLDKIQINQLSSLSHFSNWCFTLLKFLCLGIFCTIIVDLVMGDWTSVGISGILSIIFFGTQYSLIYNYNNSFRQINQFGGVQFNNIQIINNIELNFTNKIQFIEKMHYTDLFIIVLAYILRNYSRSEFVDLLDKNNSMFIHFPFIGNHLKMFVEFKINIDNKGQLKFILEKFELLQVNPDLNAMKTHEIYLMDYKFSEFYENKRMTSHHLTEPEFTNSFHELVEYYGTYYSLLNTTLTKNDAFIVINNKNTNKLNVIYYKDFKVKFANQGANHLNLDFNLVIDYLKSQLKELTLSVHDLQMVIYSKFTYNNIDYYAYNLLNKNVNNDVDVFYQEIDHLQATKQLLSFNKNNIDWKAVL